VQPEAAVVTVGLHVQSVLCTCSIVSVATSVALFQYIYICNWILIHTSIAASMHGKLSNLVCNSCPMCTLTSVLAKKNNDFS
jgi:hypothetical protein